MPPPAVSLDCRTPSESNFNPSSSSSFGAATFPSDSCSFNTSFPSSSITSLSGVGRAARPKPRLVKQRKSSKSSSSSSSSFNPFRSVSSQNADASNSCSYTQCENVGFVFGTKLNNVNHVAAKAEVSGFRDSGNVDSVNKVSDLPKQEFSFSENESHRGSNGPQGVAFCFGATSKDQIGVSHVKLGRNGVEFELTDEMRKLNIDQFWKGSFPAEQNGNVLNDCGNVSKKEDQFFVFKNVGVSSDGCGGSSVHLESDASVRDLNRNGEVVSDGNTGGVGNHCVVDDVFVFGSCGNSTKPGDSSTQSSSFPAENDGARVKEDVLSSSFSFSSLDAEVGNAKPEASSSSGERKVEFSSSVFSEGSGVSFSEFNLPHFDAPLSFTANLASGSGRKPESCVRPRGLKDKILKKSKVKAKQPKYTRLQPVQSSLSSEGVSQGEEASECYSPMDFSPYGDTSSNNDVPLSNHHDTCQTKVTSGNSSAVHTESQSNDSGTGNSSKMNSHGSEALQFTFSSDKASTGEEKFSFASSTSAQNDVSPPKRLQRRKYRMKNPSVSGNASSVQSPSLDSNPLLSKFQCVGGNFSASASKENNENKAGEELGSEAFSAAEKACEKWRRRGNEAYEKGELSKAEDFYTWGLNCISPGDASGVAFRPLVRCYSNRAATKMALGRVREAIQDCLVAVKLDPTFHRAQIRAANCYLQLGEVLEAMQCFGKCTGGNVVCLDRQVIISASDGIQKSQKVIECTDHSAELLKLRTSEAAADALQYIAEAMLISIYSEKLLEMKVQALCLLSRHEEAIKLCQKTLDFAERNFMTATPENHAVDGSSSNVRLWRNRTLLKCHFHLGNLEVARDVLEKEEKNAQDSSDPLAVTIRELLKQKNAGNTAFHSGKHAEAVEHYTFAIASSMESRPFAAICYCNRAGAHQALGQITDAISDCSLAIALDKNYAKAVSRRATLHEMIRDYRQAAADLQRMLSLLQKQSRENSKQSSSGNGKELRQVRQRLSLMNGEAKGEVPLDLYLILGIKKSDTVSEIKKAYRKAALRHHPDKAAQSLVKSGEFGEEGHNWKDIAELVYEDSDRLFKMIGEAYAVLSDPTKREEYDHEEDMRKALKECSNIRTDSRRYSEHFNQGYPFERSSNRRYWQDSYRTYSHSHRR